MNNQRVTLALKEEQTTDVLVIGGGPSGIAAAIAAARNGAKTMLVEQYGFVGGMSTAGLVGPFMTSYDNSGKTQVIKGIFDELVTRMEQEGAAIHPSKIAPGTAYASFITKGHGNVTPYDQEALKRVAEQMLLENKVELLYYTRFIEAITEEGRIKSVIVAKKQGLCAIHPTVVIDGSGDADVAVSAGVPTILGRRKDHQTQPATLFFRVAGVDEKKVCQAIEDNQELMGLPFFGAFSWLIKEAREKGDWDIKRDELGCYLSPDHRTWNMNTTRVQNVNATKSESLTGASIEGRKQIIRILTFLRKYVPGFEEAYIVASAPAIGIRESLHIEGEYEISLDDVVQSRTFADDVLLCSNSVDIHSDDGSGGEYVTVEKWYGIPYRSLIPVNCENLLVAGRTISASAEAVSAFRVMPCCYGIGQAAGTAAAMAVADRRNVREIDVLGLQKKLMEQGVFLDK